MEGLFHDVGQVPGVLYQEVVLDDRPGDTHRVTLLERIEPDCCGGNLPGNDHHRDAVHVRGGNAGDCIRDAGAGRDQCNPYIAGGPGVTVGRVDRCLLVAHQNMLDGVLLVEGVVDVEHRPTWVTPDIFDVFGLQGLDQYFRAAKFRDRGLGGGTWRGRDCCCCRGQLGFGDFHDQPL